MRKRGLRASGSIAHTGSTLQAGRRSCPSSSRSQSQSGRGLLALQILRKGSGRVALDPGTAQSSALLILACTDTVSLVNVGSPEVYLQFPFRLGLFLKPRVPLELPSCYLIPNPLPDHLPAPDNGVAKGAARLIRDSAH